MSYEERSDRNRGNNRNRDRKPYRKDSEGGNREFRPRDGNRDFKPREGNRRGPTGGKRDFRPRDGDRKPYGEKRDFRPRDGERKPYGEKRDFRPRDGESGEGRRDFKPRDRDFKPRDRDFKPRDGDRKPYGDRKFSGSRDGRRDFKPKDGERKPYGEKRDFKPRDGDRERKPYGEKRDFKPRDRDFKPRDRDFKPRDRDREYRPREFTDSEAPQEQEAPVVKDTKVTIPSTAQKVLFKGVDYEANGKTDMALILYLHGTVMLSGGCEKNAIRMLRDAGSDEFDNIKERIESRCSEEAMIAFSRMCYSLNSEYDRSVLDNAYENGNKFAIYCKIMMEEVEGDDPSVDKFASYITEDEDTVVTGLKYLIRKKDNSEKAEEYLRKNEERKKVKRSIREIFVRAMKGSVSSINELEKLSDDFPEARFLRGYLDAFDNGEAEEYLREGMDQFRPLILSTATEFGISDTAYGKYLRAKKIQTDDGEWIHAMLGAYKLGSQEAMEELRPVQTRKDVKASLETICLANKDAEGLVRYYDGEDTACLDKYCSADPQRIFEIGRLLGGAREIDWLKRAYRNGNEECKNVLIKMADDESRRGKLLVYALHDVGAELESAKLYFAMGDDPTLPATKWLAKVCVDEEAKEYVRQQFEAKDDLATFESIFVDDGYVPKHSGKNFRGKGGFKKGGKGRR